MEKMLTSLKPMLDPIYPLQASENIRFSDVLWGCKY